MNRSGYIATLRRRADELYQTRLTTPTATQSTRTHDTTDNNPSTAQRRRHQSPTTASALSTVADSVVRNHDESQTVSHMIIDLTVNTPTSPSPESITAPSASYTQLRNRRRNLTTVVTV